MFSPPMYYLYHHFSTQTRRRMTPALLGEELVCVGSTFRSWRCTIWRLTLAPQVSGIWMFAYMGDPKGWFTMEDPNLPSGNQTWLAGKSSMNGVFIRKIIEKWSTFHCHVWLREGKIDDLGVAPFLETPSENMQAPTRMSFKVPRTLSYKFDRK